MTARPPLRLAFFGGGAVTAIHYAAALRDPDVRAQITPVLVVDPSASALAKLRLPDSVIRLARPFQDALADPELAATFDAVVVALPHHLHRAAVCSALGAGKHVLCEKPAALTRADLDAMAAAREASGRVLAFCHFRRHLFGARVLTDAIRRGLWGRTLSVDWNEGGAYAWPVENLAQISRAHGGEVLHDIGAHVFDLLASWLGPLAVEECQADDAGGTPPTFRLRLSAGAVPVRVNLSRLVEFGSRVIVRFERAVAECDTGAMADVRLEGEAVPQGRVTLSSSSRAGAHTAGFAQELSAFAAACEGRGAPTVDAAAAAAYVDVFEACAGLRPPQRTSLPSTGIATPRPVVTGAAGFIGCRLVERLLAEGENPVALVRRPQTCVRLLASPVHPEICDILEPGALARHIAPGSVVYHAAVSFGGGGLMDRAIVEGTLQVLRAATAKRAAAVVLLGSMLAHGCPPESGTVGEESAFPFRQDPYGQAKARMWDAVLRQLDPSGPRVVVLEPTCVFGPHGPSFVAQPVQRLLAGTLALPDDGGGLANLIHIDNLVDAMRLAAREAARLHGRRFLVNEEEHAGPWVDYLGAFAALLGVPLAFLPGAMLEEQSRLANARKGLFQLVREAVRAYPPAAKAMSAHPAFRAWHRLRHGAGGPSGGTTSPAPVSVSDPTPVAVPAGAAPFYANPTVLALYRSRAVYSSATFRRETGWSPRLPRGEALRDTLNWIRDTWPHARVTHG